MTETADGHTLTVNAVVTGGAGPATIPPAGTATVDLSDLYTDVPGSLVVTKTIGGAAAGKQGAITIVPTCDGTKLDAWVIPAGTAAGSVSKKYPAIAAGADCTVTETVDGHTSTVAVRQRSGQEVTIPADGTATAAVTDTYTDIPGSLVVNKTIAGNAAGKQGQVTIGVTCDGTALPDFVIPAGADAGTVSKTYTGIAAGSSCTITETADGHTLRGEREAGRERAAGDRARGGRRDRERDRHLQRRAGDARRPQDDRGAGGGRAGGDRHRPDLRRRAAGAVRDPGGEGEPAR